jgi:hypothetical protein
VNDLARRDLSEADYDLLLQLEATNKAVYSQIPEKVIKSWPSEKIRENSLLLNPGHQCRICLRAYQVNQMTRKIPVCKHRFHLDCIDNWLLHSHPTCPIDGLVVWDPETAQQEKEEKLKKQQNKLNPTANAINSKSAGSTPLAELTGMGMLINYKSFTTADFKAPPSLLITKSDLAKLAAKNQRASSSELPGNKVNKVPAPARLNNDIKIEVEGNGLTLNQLLGATNRVNKTLLPDIQMRPNRRLVKLGTGSSGRLTRESNNVLFRRNLDASNVAPSNALNVGSLIKSRPYQLARMQSDFDDASTQLSEDEATTEDERLSENGGAFLNAFLAPRLVDNSHDDELPQNKEPTSVNSSLVQQLNAKTSLASFQSNHDENSFANMISSYNIPLNTNVNP